MKSELERGKNHVEPDNINMLVQVHDNVQELRNVLYTSGMTYIVMLRVDRVIQNYLNNIAA